MKDTSRRGLAIALTLAFLFAMVMGTGPGVLLVNHPRSFLGLPLLYTWAIFWYVVQVMIALVAYFWLWRDAGVTNSAANGSGTEEDE
ncbi:hypothetical protein [Planctomycetes bacterium Pan216]